MKDRFGRTIDYMRISITDRCNLRCRYCMPDTISPVPGEAILSYEEMETVCHAAARAGISRFKITGGEPLVREGCAGFIGRLKKIPGIRQVTMTTNGILLDRYLPQLLEHGLDAVNISLDTLNADVYEQITGRNELFRVLDNTGLAVDAGLPVKVNCVLIKGINDREWQELAELSRNLKIDIRFIEMMPIGHGKKFEPVYNDLLLKQLLEQYPDLEKDRRVHGNGPAVYYRLPGARGSIGFISAMHGKFCGSCNRLRLTSQGKLKPCLCYADSVDVRSILRGEVSVEAFGKNMDNHRINLNQEKELCEAISEAVSQKPGMHQFEAADGVTEQAWMAQIGG